MSPVHPNSIGTHRLCSLSCAHELDRARYEMGTVMDFRFFWLFLA